MNQSVANRFTPIRGTESQILSSEPTKGYVWFAIDTKKIYYSNGEDFISMGGNSSIYYANMELDEEPQQGQKEFEFRFSEIDKDSINNIPNINDLILNIPDGCFYRVLNIYNDEEIIIATKLTIAGSGSGVGEDSTTGSYIFDRIGTEKPIILKDNDCFIKFNYIATDASGDSTGNAKTKLIIRGIVVKDFYIEQGETEINIGEYLELGTNIVEIKTMVNTGGSDFEKTKRWTVNVVDVSLNWEYDETYINLITNPLTLSWAVTGNVSKTTHIVIDDFYTIDTDKTELSTTQSLTIQPEELIEKGLTHGAHKIEMYVTAEVGSSIITIPSIVKYFIFVDLNSTQPIISCNFIKNTLIQYNTIQIPIIIYNPKSENGSKVYLRENSVEKDVWENVPNCTIQYWSYTPITAEEKTLIIICNEVERRLTFNVEPLNINNKELLGYAFKLKASDFSSNIALQNWENNGINATFSENFDWINGGLKNEVDENGENRQFICIKAGTSMTINYEMFGQFQRSAGKSIKIIFKATRCRDYDAQVLKCYDDDRNVGLILRAQNAIYKSEQTTINTQYCEDTYLEFETDIWKNPTNPTIVNGADVTPRYIMTWLDGVPCDISVYSSIDSFITNPAKHEKIVIGSNDCDVYLYLIKVYEKALSNEEHISNFIADSLNAKQMLSRYERNDILDESGEISYLKLAKANPNCLVHLYEMDHMSTKKSDKVVGCNYTQYHGSDYANLTAENVTVKVQGTSSAYYGEAAFNLDAEFKNGFNHADGTHTDGWSMTEDAIPVNYFTNKVNVASCEQANNALNQEWYNRFQPYICRYKNKEHRARDTMQFTPGVLFIKDLNEKTNETDHVNNNVFKEIPGYVNKPYYKLYSICNMGNSKKNIEVFHDTANPYECCVEVTDNQTKGQWMTEVPGYKQIGDDLIYEKEITNGIVSFTGNEDNGTLEAHLNGLTEEERTLWDNAVSDGGFEFRYPDGAATDSHKAAFFRLVQWMSQNDPSPKYEKINIRNAEDFQKRLTGFYADEVNQTDWVDPVILYTEQIEQEFPNEQISKSYVIAENYDPEETYFAVYDHPHGYTNAALEEPVTFGDYIFSDSEFTQKLKGLKISTYNKTYYVDCYDYRIAKMLSECEDYLIMDAVVYHYLFIERHCMIDNVAKNTFWSTEDLIHWGPIKDYDNDTADGNDNQGRLTLSYGYEALDPIEDRYVFNAHQSVWLNFIHGLETACAAMYKELEHIENENAWEAKSYLKLFEDWQNCIPERVWIECYYRLYLRPREIYGNDEFLTKLAGGKKTHQRKQYETYQELYINSKYGTSNSFITLRTNGQNLLGYTIPVTMYSDCYIKTTWGQNVYNKRVKRKEVNNIVCPVNSTNNADVHFYFPQLYQTIGDINKFVPEVFDPSACIRLREFITGEDFTNENLHRISFANNIQLEKLIIKNCPNTNIVLDLSQAIALKELDATGSGFTGIQIADGAPLEKLYVKSPSSLRLYNLKFINDFYIENPTAISSLDINNIDQSPGINSKNLVDNATNLNFYGLKNVDWLINDNNEINDEEKTINILERLKRLQGRIDGNEKQLYESLSGILNISEIAYNSNESFDIYNKYAQKNIYPDMDIIFNGSTAQLYSIKIYDGNDELQWFRKITAGNDMNSTFLLRGPKGEFNIDKIKKSSTESTDFEFANKWKVYNTESDEPIDIIEAEIPIIENINEDLILKPIFNANIRQYQVKFYNDNVLLNPNNFIFDYGTLLKDAMPKIIPYKDDSMLSVEETNAFVGYGLSNGSINTIRENFVITDNLDLYAIFKLKSVYDNTLNPIYYELVNYRNGYKIQKKDNVQYQGKITLPIISPTDGKPILGISDSGFQNAGMSYVFWEKNNNIINQVENIGQAAFQNCANLYYFEMPNNVNYIRQNTFQGCNLMFTESSTEEIKNWFSNITTIERLAFNEAGYNNRNGINATLYLSNELTVLGDSAFARAGFKRVVIGATQLPTQLIVENCGVTIFTNNRIQVESITIYVENTTDSKWVTLKEKISGTSGPTTFSIVDAYLSE